MSFAFTFFGGCTSKSCPPPPERLAQPAKYLNNARRYQAAQHYDGLLEELPRHVPTVQAECSKCSIFLSLHCQHGLRIPHQHCLVNDSGESCRSGIGSLCTRRAAAPPAVGNPAASIHTEPRLAPSKRWRAQRPLQYLRSIDGD
eukprot:6175683-Pleurochrysis_carterae.AAC.2